MEQAAQLGYGLRKYRAVSQQAIGVVTPGSLTNRRMSPESSPG